MSTADIEGDDTVDQGELTEQGDEDSSSTEEEKQRVDTTHPLEMKEECEEEDHEPEVHMCCIESNTDHFSETCDSSMLECPNDPFSLPNKDIHYIPSYLM